MEAFSDGVLAIIITIMVLEMKVPLAETFVFTFGRPAVASCCVAAIAALH